MNERINSLFAQAAGKNMPDGVDNIHVAELERFAALLIAECVGCIDYSPIDYPAVQRIKRHFGIEYHETVVDGLKRQ